MYKAPFQRTFLKASLANRPAQTKTSSIREQIAARLTSPVYPSVFRQPVPVVHTYGGQWMAASAWVGRSRDRSDQPEPKMGAKLPWRGENSGEKNWTILSISLRIKIERDNATERRRFLSR